MIYFQTFDIAAPETGTTVALASPAVQRVGGGLGDCLNDTFSISSPGNSGSPIICGFNTGQHSEWRACKSWICIMTHCCLTLDWLWTLATPATWRPLTLEAAPQRGSGTSRSHSTHAEMSKEVKRINHNSFMALYLFLYSSGPDGCLQYFTGSTGTISR